MDLQRITTRWTGKLGVQTSHRAAPTDELFSCSKSFPCLGINCFMRFLLTLVLALFALAVANPLHADMVLDNAIIHFSSGDPKRKDVTVSNPSKRTLYVQVIPYQIEAPGTPQQKRVAIRNPKIAGLLVSPNKLAIPPGASKRVRFVDLFPKREQEGVYRVVFKPVTGTVQGNQTGVKLLIGYEVLVLAQPNRPTPKIVSERKNGSLIIRNQGNTDIYLRQGKQCPHEDAPAKQCTSLTDKRLYPGNRWAQTLPGNGPVIYQVGIGTKHSIKVF